MVAKKGVEETKASWSGPACPHQIWWRTEILLIDIPLFCKKTFQSTKIHSNIEALTLQRGSVPEKISI